jgi:hypothetical protein
MSNLWGAIPEPIDIRTPKMLLEQQAAQLQEMTSGALTCSIQTGSNASNEIDQQMRLVAPSLGNYSVALLVVRHQVVAYPCQMYSPFLGTAAVECDGETQLVDALGRILQDSKTHKLIGNLLAQIKAEGALAA